MKYRFGFILFAAALAVFGAFGLFAADACGAEFYQFPEGASPFENGLFLHSCEASGTLTANPWSGTAPLNGVDLTLTPSGTVTNNTYRYYFDCTNDGSWELTIDLGGASGYLGYTAVDLCNYTSGGSYIAFSRWDYPAGTLRYTTTTQQAIIAYPAAPLNFAGAALNETSISWSWNSSAGATYYEVRRFSDNVLLATTTSLSWTQSVVPNNAYQNYATACITAGCGPASNNASVTTKLNKPTGMTGTAQPGGTSILWGWTDNSAYESWNRLKVGGTTTEVATTTGNSKLESGLTPGNNYCRYVTAYEVSPAGESDPSDPNGQAGVCVNSGASYQTTGSLESPIFDTRQIGGASYQYVMWRGDKPSGTSVDFQFASSNSTSGPWTYVGSDCLPSSSYSNVLFDTPLMITQACHTGQRYFRYLVKLNGDGLNTPIIRDIILGWSP